MPIDKDSEAIVFAQVDANLDTNPKVRKAGSFGRQVFEFLLRRNALRGFKGSVPIAFVDPDYLADVLMIAPNDAVTGVTKAVTANLIAIDDTSSFVRIVGWHESWGRRAKEGKERTKEWRDRKAAKSPNRVTARDDGDETPSRETVGDKSDAYRSEEKRSDLDTHTRARERHPAAGGIGRRVWDQGAKVRAELVAENVQVPPWPSQFGSDHSGWTALLDRVCEQLVGSTPELAEQVCMNRIAVAKAKAIKDGDGNWFACTSLFTRNSFETFASLDPKQFSRKPPKQQRSAGGTIGSATPRTDHGDAMRPAREVI